MFNEIVVVFERATFVFNMYMTVKTVSKIMVFLDVKPTHQIHYSTYLIIMCVCVLWGFKEIQNFANYISIIQAHINVAFMGVILFYFLANVVIIEGLRLNLHAQ